MKKEDDDLSRVEPPVVAADRLDLPRKPQPDSSLQVPREVLVNADAYLSLLWFRPSTRHDTELQIEVPRTIAALRRAYEHPQQPTMADAAEMLWVVLANVSGGDWTKQSADWQEAAARWRDNYQALIK